MARGRGLLGSVQSFSGHSAAECSRDDKLGTLCFIGSGEGVSLKFLVEDYMLHMQHHLDHLLQREHVTKYPA